MSGSEVSLLCYNLLINVSLRAANNTNHFDVEPFALHSVYTRIRHLSSSSIHCCSVLLSAVLFLHVARNVNTFGVFFLSDEHVVGDLLPFMVKGEHKLK